MKFYGLQLYQLGMHAELLMEHVGNPAEFREKLGTVERQDPKIHQWPLSKKGEGARMRAFLRASLQRKIATETQRKQRRVSVQGEIAELDSEAAIPRYRISFFIHAYH